MIEVPGIENKIFNECEVSQECCSYYPKSFDNVIKWNGYKRYFKTTDDKEQIIRDKLFFVKVVMGAK
jgi:hypothetical protein